MPISIRQYREADNPLVKKLHYDGLNQSGAFIDNPALDADLDNIEKVYLKNRGEFLVGFEANRLIAMGALKRVSDTIGEIKRMRVVQDYQRQGIGQRIFDRLVQCAQELGYTKLVLDTSVLQVAAQKFYEKNGFTEVRRDILHGLACIFYEKSLCAGVKSNPL